MVGCYPSPLPSHSHNPVRFARRTHITPIPLAILAGGFLETQQGEVRFPEIPTNILDKICQPVLVLVAPLLQVSFVILPSTL
jgi:hypothetical protein